MPESPAERRADGHGPLSERAYRLLVDAPDGLTDAALADMLFGSVSGAGWAPILTATLAGDARMVRQGAVWRLAGKGFAQADVDVSTPHLHAPIVAMALATTGADPRRHRIAHLAVVALAAGEIVARLDTPIQTGERLAGYLRAATRTNLDDVATAPALAELIPALQLITDEQRVYVYGARRADAFLMADLRRVGLPPLPIQLHEADDLLRAQLPGHRKPGLLAAARELGVPYGHAGRPLADAEALARVIQRLRERQGATPGRAFGNDSSLPGLPVRPLPFTRDWLRDVPEGPGVYIFLDGVGRTLYVGKARSLSRRLGDYVRRQPGSHRQLEALAVRAANVTTIPVASDLEAALLEARLIRERHPEFNVAREPRPLRTVIRAGPDEASPHVQLVGAVANDGARYFGPFESSSAARAALETARAVYPAAFSRKRGDVTVQRAAVLDACRLFAGQKSPALVVLREQMAAAAARGDQPEVDRLRAALRDVQALDVRPSLLAGLPTGAQLLVLEQIFEGLTRTHLIQDGVRLVSVSWAIDYLPNNPEALRDLAASMLAASEAPVNDSDEDEGNADVSAQSEPPDPNEPALVMRWLVQAWARVEIARVPPPDEPNVTR